MSEMIERVARAIALASLDYETRAIVDPKTWPVADSYCDMARAAIEAMRTPTDAMKRQGWHELRKHNDIQTRLGNSLVGVETPTYQAMIDAALTPAKVDEAG